MNAITKSPGLYWPLSRKYDVIDGKYKFFNVANAHRMQTYYPLVQRDRFSSSCTRSSHSSGKSQISTQSEMDMGGFTVDSNATSSTINDLSDDILLGIFNYFHPIDLIHCFSLVCHRWNYLVKHSSLVTEVRVLINDLSLKYGSVKTFFHGASQRLRKLCIDCSVPLPSAEVNALFDICFPKVIHLDIGTFKEMNTTLLAKLSNCFPNVETLHMDEVERSSKCDEDIEEWMRTLEMLFEGESIFPKVRNLFIGDIRRYNPKRDRKLLTCRRPFDILFVQRGIENLTMIGTSSWQSTLTELHLGIFLRRRYYRHICCLHNLKVFSWVLSFETSNEDFAHIKKLYNLEELYVRFSGEDCYVTSDGLIAAFTLPKKEPEKSFPYKLKHLVMWSFCSGDIDVFDAINRNCPNLKTLGLPSNFFLLESGVIHFIVSNFKRLVSLDLSNLHGCYEDEDDVWNDIKDDDLPDLRLLRLDGNEVNIENLQRLNLKRPKLLISTRRNYFINWTKTESGCVFHDTFDGDIRAVMNDLSLINGLHYFTFESNHWIGSFCSP